MAKILVAEDDRAMRRVIQKGIESTTDHTVILASDGQRAWEILNDNSDISMLITDMMMPNMDGRQLIKIVRGNEAFNDLPIMIISAVMNESQIADLLCLGAAAFMPKPLNLGDLVEYVKMYLD